MTFTRSHRQARELVKNQVSHPAVLLTPMLSWDGCYASHVRRTLFLGSCLQYCDPAISLPLRAYQKPWVPMARYVSITLPVWESALASSALSSLMNSEEVCTELHGARSRLIVSTKMDRVKVDTFTVWEGDDDSQRDHPESCVVS